ncbi:cupin domain-containing protein [Bradyrhizobium sp. RDT10]
MKIVSQSLLIGIVVLASAASAATAQTADAHKIVSPQEIKWGPAPAFPPGAELAVLYGDPSKEGVFATRLKAAKGYYIPPHTHPKPEINTVISGTVRLGMGETADHSKAQPLPAGSFFALPPGMAHYVFVDEDTVVQVNTSGPWGINYVNPKDDPRKSQ